LHRTAFAALPAAGNRRACRARCARCRGDRNRVKHCGGSVSEVAQGLGGARHL